MNFYETGNDFYLLVKMNGGIIFPKTNKIFFTFI